MKKINNLDNLKIVSGGSDISLYDWKNFTTAIVKNIEQSNSYLTIRYAPDGPINHAVGGWSNGEQVYIHPNHTMNGKDSIWYWGYRNGFYGWVNGKYLI